MKLTSGPARYATHEPGVSPGVPTWVAGMPIVTCRTDPDALRAIIPAPLAMATRPEGRNASG